MTQRGGNETWKDSGDIKKLQYKGCAGLSHRRENQRLYHVSDLNNWIYIIHWYKKREWRGKLGRKIMSSVLDILNFRYLNTSLICECEQQMLRYIGLTFTRVSWLEAQARYLQLSCHRNLKVRLKKSCQKNRRKLSGGRCHRSQQNPSR